MPENMQNLAKYAAHICVIYAAYFSTYFRRMQIQLKENHNCDH